MATWKADIKTTPTGSTYSVTVEAGASYVANQEIQRLYNPIYIRNLRQVSGGSSASSSADSSGLLAVGAVILGLALLVSFWWIIIPVGIILAILYAIGSAD